MIIKKFIREYFIKELDIKEYNLEQILEVAQLNGCLEYVENKLHEFYNRPKVDTEVPVFDAKLPDLDELDEMFGIDLNTEQNLD